MKTNTRNTSGKKLHTAAGPLILLLTLIFTLTFCRPSHADNFKGAVGIKTYYSFWQPCWKNYYSSFELGQGIMAGPLLSITLFERLSLSWAGLYMLSPYDVSMEESGTISSVPSTLAYEKKVSRMDQDIALSIKAFSIFSIFAGFKTFQVDSEQTKDSNNIFFTSMGPGAGISAAFPLTDKIIISSSLSYVYMSAECELAFSESFDITPRGVTGTGDDYDPTKTYRSQGLNAVAGVSYFFDLVDTLLTLGFRYQQLFYKSEEDDVYNIDGTSDIFYGVELSALYLF